MTPPENNNFSGWSPLWMILWIVSGVVLPSMVLLTSMDSQSDTPLLVIKLGAVTNAVASIGLGVARKSPGLFVLMLFGGWLVLGGLFLAGCAMAFQHI